MNDEENGQVAFLGSSSRASTMADGSLRLQIDIAPAFAVAAFTAFGVPGSAVALARLTDEAAVEEERPGKVAKGQFGKFAKALVASGFFRVPAIWEGIGTDEEYLEWIKHQPSALSGDYSEWHDDGEKYCVPAHVRRVEHGSGTGIKPAFSAIPLTSPEHAKCHQTGDSAIGTEDWWSKMRIKHVSDWAFLTLKEKLGYDSYTEIAPHRIVAWAKQRDLERYLPREFTDHGAAEESTAEGAD